MKETMNLEHQQKWTGVTQALELAFKLCYLLLAFATLSTYLYQTPLQPVLVRLTLVLGAGVLLLRLPRWRSYIRVPGFWLLGLLCASLLLSSLLNRDYGLTENLKWVLWLGIQGFGLYLTDPKREADAYRKEAALLMQVYLWLTTAASVLSLGMLVWGYGAIQETAQKETLLTGMVWGRLWGVYRDPNYGAVAAVAGLLLGLYFLLRKRGKLRLLYGLSLALNYLYLSFSDSRTGQAALGVGLGFFLFWVLKDRLTIRGNGRRIGLSLVAALAISGTLVGGLYGVKDGYNRGIAPFLKEWQQSYKPGGGKKPGSTAGTLGRGEELSSDLSNGRMELWGSALEVWETSPVYGAGYSGLPAYAKDHTPNTYLIHNESGAEYTSLHNQFFNVLVYQGALGLILFLAFLARLLARILPGVLKSHGNQSLGAAALAACLSVVGVSMLFLTEGFYTVYPGSFLFWVFSGYLMHGYSTGDPEEPKEPGKGFLRERILWKKSVS